MLNVKVTGKFFDNVGLSTIEKVIGGENLCKRIRNALILDR